MPDGCNNAGILKVEQRDELNYIQKRFGVEDILEGKAEYEMKILRSLKHRNIVEFVAASMVLHPRSEPSASLYMECCDMRILEDSFKSHYCRREYVAEPEDALLGGSPVLGWKGVMHRDIKPDIIFLCRQRYSPDPRVVLGDFGVARRPDIRRDDCRETLSGDPDWLPPEHPFYGFRSDIWAIGAVVQEACRLNGPPSRHGFRYLGLGPSYSEDLQDLVADMMIPGYDDRLNSRGAILRIRAASGRQR